ncbi:DUF4139 domain-containing protein [Frigoriglobus tundricola]|uniref:DUF4139 domain-containing protein n=1 Tax=Frigoriglobus tundricola TaxID=2774151 RepID=A0A6M5YQ06_9BACT|nr:DUF4139 domain-containing protein [Frigoriglobus tundricola]QJW96008.1 hypothetical protein FTUN_3562 [Frigoriglobus tundricola]
MRTIRVLAAGLALALLGSPAPADDTPVKSKIVGVDLFKNGLAIVKREATLGRAGTYTIDDVPTPVHGTFYIDSTGTVDVAVRMRDVEVPATETVPGNLQDDLAGKKVVVHFRGDKRAPVAGTMMKIKPPRADEQAAAGRFLVLQTAKGRVYLEPSEVMAVESEDAGTTVTRRRPQLALTLAETDKAETKVTIRYIATGLSWAPSYRLDISDPKTLALEQNAVVRNELADLDGAEVRLISGYPSVQYAHVRSLISPRATFASFFAELAGGRSWEADAASNSIVSQQAVSLNLRAPGGGWGGSNLALGATPAGEGVDLHYQSIGKRTLAAGDALALTVARGKAEYERIVEWLVPDTRNAHGQPEGNGEGDVWDALKFKNPLAFPMTTGPATVTANGQFNGQRTSYWVNSGEETVLHVEKALSVRTRATETEQLNKDGSGRDLIWLGGRQYRKTTVEGELAVSNHRKETIALVIRRRFSGELVQADGDPKRQLREEGVYSVNKRQEMLWTLPLKGGEEKKLKYTYTVLMPH